MYENGSGVVQDYREAVKWYKKAAQQGNASAPYYLGFRYYKGEGVVQDYREAHKWWNIAAAQGDEDARKARDALAQKMSTDQIASAQRLASEWQARHSQP
jgi:TPR repeat protein